MGTLRKNTVMEFRPKQWVLHGQKRCPYSPQSKMQNLKISKIVINFKWNIAEYSFFDVHKETIFVRSLQ